MITLILLMLLFVAVTAWFMARPFRTTLVEQEAQAQAGQYALARDRLLRQLEQLEAQAADGIVDKTAAEQETRRLEIELADVLKWLEDFEAAAPGPQMDREGKLVWWLALAGFAVVLPLGSLLMYGGWQGDTLLKLASEPLAPGMPAQSQTTASTAAPEPAAQAPMQNVPPEALAMVARLEKKLVNNPNDGDGWKRLGRSYTVMGKYSEAVSAYTSAAELLPNDNEIRQALQQLAQIAGSRGRHPEQGSGGDTQAAHPKMPDGSLDHIVKLERMVGDNPKDAMSWARLGRAYINIDRLPEAGRAYSKAYELEPENVVILAGYAEAEFKANPRDPDARAFELYTKLYEMDPKHRDGLFFLGLAAYSEGNLGRARQMWTDLLKVLPPEGEGYASVKNALAQVELLSNNPK